MPDSVSVAPAGQSARPLLGNLMQLYLHDLSEFTNERVSESGIYEYAYLDLYWTEPERHPFVISVGDEVAGFALVREIAPQLYELAEFFVLRSFRGRCVGEQAAVALFRRFPGTWQVAQEDANLPAQAFWRKVIGTYTGGKFAEERSEAPCGPRQVFRVTDPTLQ
jgi:predicted acetyltransferase